MAAFQCLSLFVRVSSRACSIVSYSEKAHNQVHERPLRVAEHALNDRQLPQHSGRILPEIRVYLTMLICKYLYLENGVEAADFQSLGGSVLSQKFSLTFAQSLSGALPPSSAS